MLWIVILLKHALLSLERFLMSSFMVCKISLLCMRNSPSLWHSDVSALLYSQWEFSCWFFSSVSLHLCRLKYAFRFFFLSALCVCMWADSYSMSCTVCFLSISFRACSFDSLLFNVVKDYIGFETSKCALLNLSCLRHVSKYLHLITFWKSVCNRSEKIV